jgi:hypothetical protein
MARLKLAELKATTDIGEGPEGSSFETLLALDAKLSAAGHHPLLEWWGSELQRFYAHPTALSLIERVGRGGAKSNTSVKVGVNEILNGKFDIPPGEVHYWAQVSESKGEAAERLRLYESFFRALGIEYQQHAGDSIIIPSLRRGVRVFACTIGAVSGFRCIGYAADEAAKWENRDHSANPAQEVIVSIEAMTVTHPKARALVISSPWGVDDYHYELFERGDTDDQLVGSAPTWVANPTVTREQCLIKAKGDEKILDREYGAIPGSTVTSAFDSLDLKQAFLTRLTPSDRGATAVAIDASSLRGDAFAWLVGEECKDGIRISLIDAVEGEALREHKMQDVVDRVVKCAREATARRVFGDQREAASLESMFGTAGLGFTAYNWNQSSKDEAFQLLRKMLREKRIEFCEHPKLRQELRDVKARLVPSGVTVYATNGLDYLSAVITLIHAILAGDFRESAPGGPTRAFRSGNNSHFADDRSRGFG